MIIQYIAENSCKEISNKVIKSLRKMTEGMQSGDDSGLKNIWDEVCVQAQSGYSGVSGAYLHTIFRLINSEIDALDKEIAWAIWLQTREGDYWADEIEDKVDDGELSYFDQKDVDYNIDDINEYVLYEYVLQKAGSFTNKRIEKAIDEGYDI